MANLEGAQEVGAALREASSGAAIELGVRTGLPFGRIGGRDAAVALLRGVACPWREDERRAPIADVELLRELRSVIDGEIARRASTGIAIEENGRDVADCPPGGALLCVRWCTSDGADRTWFPDGDAARAALLKFAEGEGKAPREDGMFVDLTPPGCVESSAWVELRT